MVKLIAAFVSGIAYVLSLTAIVCSTGFEQSLALLLGIGFTLLEPASSAVSWSSSATA